MAAKTEKKVTFSEEVEVKDLKIDYEDDYEDENELARKLNGQDSGTSESKGSKRTRDPSDPNAELNMEFDRHFITWLKQIKHSFILTSYKRSTIFSIGQTFNEEHKMDKISIWLNNIPRVTGACLKDNTLWLAGSGQLLKYMDYGSLPSPDDGNTDFDATYMPKKIYITSDVDTHDICVGDDGTPYFVSTLYSCVCKPSEGINSVEVYWKPEWISKIAAEDRCHLNGLCSRDGKPKYVTTVSKSDVKEGWREHRGDRGLVVDIETNEVLCSNLSMPHSPRWHNGKLWLLEAGTGYFGYLDPNLQGDNKFVKKTFIPGFLRGLSFVDNRYAVICSSHDRYENVFQGLKLNKELTDREVQTRCGMHVVNLETFDIEHNLVFTSGVVEIYDVVAVPNKTRPKLYDLADSSVLLNHKMV
jgi:uncharacterized protein (TIGR03032 family)